MLLKRTQFTAWIYQGSFREVSNVCHLQSCVEVASMASGLNVTVTLANSG